MIDSLTHTSEVNYPVANLPVQEWDMVITCFEPLHKVTGGIGTYHRLLIEEMAEKGVRQLILTNSANAKWVPPEGVSLFFVDEFQSDKPYNFVGLEHERFSLHCHFALRYLFNAGHRFSFVEFSDYGGDGFYPLRAREAGVYDLGTAAVRLHSPNVMLIEDNGKRHSEIDQYRRDIIDREMSAYEDCDVILFGGTAMRDRVLQLASKFGLNLSNKMVSCPHPYPKALFDRDFEAIAVKTARETTIQTILNKNSMADRTSLEAARIVGIFGRIEDRKGQFQFISELLRDPSFISYLKSTDIHFLVAGHNVLDHIGNFRLADLYDMIYQAGLSGRFHFTGKVSQELLAEFSIATSGYIFPSVFENYPNALLEVLPTTKPIAVSSNGCMPEITKGFRDVLVFDPLNVDSGNIQSFLDALPASVVRPDAFELTKRISTLEMRQDKMISYYLGKHETQRTSTQSPQSVGFVVPIYQVWKYLDETLTSIRAAMRDGDQLVVVDDASKDKDYAEIKRICAAHGVTMLRLLKNGGPTVSRLRGVDSLDTDLIQFCDADDLLNAEGINYARHAFAKDPDLTMVTGIMSCFQDSNHYWVPRNGMIWTAIDAHFAHSGSMFRKADIALALSAPQDRLPLNEDWLASLLILAQGGKARMLPVVTYHYRRFDGTRSTLNLAEIGSVHAKIISRTFENWSFSCSAQNARLRELLAGSYLHGRETTKLSVSPHFPLRYKILDSLFFRLVRFKAVETMMLKIRSKVYQRL